MQEIFISYSSKDQQCADEIVAYLEERGFSCFIAHRDIKAGEAYDMRLIDAVEHAKLLVLVFSDNSDMSKHVKAEIAMAFDSETTIIPYKITSSKPTQLKYYLQTAHWLDATDPEDNHLENLFGRICEIIQPSDNKQRAMLAVSQLLTDSQLPFDFSEVNDYSCYTKLTVVPRGDSNDPRIKRKLMMLESEAQYRLHTPTRIYRDKQNNLVFELTHDKNKSFDMEDALNRVSTQKMPFLPVILGLDESVDEVRVSKLSTLDYFCVLGAEGSGKRNFIYNLIHGLMATRTPSEVNFAVFGDKQYYRFLENSPYLAWEITKLPISQIESRLLEVAKQRAQVLCDKEEEVADLGALYSPDKPSVIPHLVVIFDEIDVKADCVKHLFDTNFITYYSNKEMGQKLHYIWSTNMYFILSADNSDLGQIHSNMLDKNVVCHTLSSAESSLDAIGIDAATKLCYASGDVFFQRHDSRSGKSAPQRLLVPYVSEEYIEKAAKQGATLSRSTHTDNFDNSEPKYVKLDSQSWKALKVIIENGFGTTALLQRKFGLGFNAASRILDRLEELGYIVKTDSRTKVPTVSEEDLPQLLDE